MGVTNVDTTRTVQSQEETPGGPNTRVITQQDTTRNLSNSVHKVDTGEVALIADLDAIEPIAGALMFVEEDGNIYRADGSAWAIVG